MAQKFEITPEMINAGLRELAYFSPREDSAEAREEIIIEIYCAMHLARPLRQHPRCK